MTMLRFMFQAMRQIIQNCKASHSCLDNNSYLIVSLNHSKRVYCNNNVLAYYILLNWQIPKRPFQGYYCYKKILRRNSKGLKCLLKLDPGHPHLNECSFFKT